MYADIPVAKEEKARLLGNGGDSSLSVCTDLAWQPDSGIQGDRRVNEASAWWNVAFDSVRVIQVSLLRHGALVGRSEIEQGIQDLHLIGLTSQCRYSVKVS